MASGIGQNSSSIGLFTSISRGGGSVSSIVGGQGAANLISQSVADIDALNQARDARRNGTTGQIDANQALFGDLANNLFGTLGAISQARVAQILGNDATSTAAADERAELTQRLSQLSLEQLAVLENAASDDPEVSVPVNLQRSFENLSDRDLLTFRLAVRDAIDNVVSRQGGGSSSSDSGSLFNVEV